MTSAQIAIMTTIILYLCLVIFTGVMIGLYAADEAGRTADFTDLHLTHTENS